jgi:uncharacterized protein YbjT (DUF2867 family)
MNILVIGATGSIGSLVVEEALRQGNKVRALVRNSSKARQLPREEKMPAVMPCLSLRPT